MVDDGGKQPVPIAKMILDDPGAHPGAFDDVPGAGSGKSFFADAPDRLFNDEFPRALGTFLTAMSGLPWCDAVLGSRGHRCATPCIRLLGEQCRCVATWGSVTLRRDRRDGATPAVIGGCTRRSYAGAAMR